MGMMNMGGSLRYDMHGRKRKAYKKNNPTVKKTRVVTKARLPAVPDRLQEIRDYNARYPSMMTGGNGKGQVDSKWQAEKREISKGYTVAPAYNKGAYQVIGKSNIKDIGK
jgi:hypothetical protein